MSLIQKAGIVCVLLAFWFLGFAPSNTFTILVVLAFLLFIIQLISFVAAVIYRESNLTQFLWYAVALALIVPTLRFGHWARNQLFESKLPQYVNAVNTIKKSLPPGKISIDHYPASAFSNVALRIIVLRRENGPLIIEFVTAGHFPIWDSGYLFTSDGSESDQLKHYWQVLQRINGQWFYFSD